MGLVIRLYNFVALIIVPRYNVLLYYLLSTNRLQIQRGKHEARSSAEPGEKSAEKQEAHLEMTIFSWFRSVLIIV